MNDDIDEAFDMFDEDECTLEFGEEDEEGDFVSNKAQRNLFKEYHGEDYSKYLDEEDDTHDPSIHKTMTHWRLPPESIEIQGDTIMSTVEQNGSSRRGSLTTLKQKVGKFLTSGRSKKSSMQKESNANSSAPKMYEFSYADSKIGSSILNGGTGVSIDSGCDTMSRPPLESRSDIGSTSRSSWWDVGTLSVRKTNNMQNSVTEKKEDHNSISRRHRKSKSVTNLSNFNNVGSRQSQGSSFQSVEVEPVLDSSAIWMPMTSNDGSISSGKSHGKLATALRRMSKGLTKSDKSAIAGKS